MSGSTWRKHPFVTGQHYLALSDNPDFTQGEIKSGQQYLLTHIGHSHYDGASIFTFKCLTEGSKVSWWWFDQEPEHLCKTHFKLVTSLS